MKIYNGLIRIFRKAKFDQLSEKSFNHWKNRAESFYEREETIWENFCRIELINPASSYKDFLKESKKSYSDRQKYIQK